MNYEARTSNDPLQKQAKRRLKNFKLKHNRLLSCFSALSMLTAIHAQRGSVSREDAREICRKSPTERIEWLEGKDDHSIAHPFATRILDAYERFLEVCSEPESSLIAKFQEPDFKREQMESARNLGRAVFDLLRVLGCQDDEPTEVYQVIVV